MMKLRRSEKGFTLIEIIAVLVLLGILAAIAVPRYVDLQDDAKKKALQGALAAGGSNVAMEYARQILVTGDTPAMASLAGALNTCCQTVGDFEVTYAASGTGIEVTTTSAPTEYGTVDHQSRTFNLQ